MKFNLKSLILAISEMTDLVDPKIARHQQRTTFIAMEIAKYGKAERKLVEDIFAASLLHDIGAISIEEKVSLYAFEELNHQTHCIRGAVLLAKLPWLNRVARIVRNHHTRCPVLKGAITDPVIFASQVLYLADYVERLVDRERYILHQAATIISQVIKLKGVAVHEQIIDLFLEVSKREEFWLDLVSTHLYTSLFHEDPYYDLSFDADFGINELAAVAELFRDIIDFKSPFTATHSSGVSAGAGKLAELFGFSEADVELMKIAGNLHDVGKMIIPNRILEKAGRLTEAEFAIIKSHTYYTYYIIKPIGGLGKVAEWAAYHHEKLDGSGYPFHRCAEELDVGARMMAVADIFTAGVEDRPYRKGMTRSEIYKVMKDQADQGLIDARIVELLFDNYDAVINYVREKQKTAREFYEKRFLPAALLEEA